MKKSIIAFMLIALTACQVTEQQTIQYISVTNTIEQCLYPEQYANGTLYKNLSRNEQTLLQNIKEKELRRIIGNDTYRTLKGNTPVSRDMRNSFHKNMQRLKHNKTQNWGDEWCADFKDNYFTTLKNIEKQQAQAEKEQQDKKHEQ